MKQKLIFKSNFLIFGCNPGFGNSSGQAAQSLVKKLNLGLGPLLLPDSTFTFVYTFIVMMVVLVQYLLLYIVTVVRFLESQARRSLSKSSSCSSQN